MSSMDDIFKKKLFDHEEAVPSDMWSNILAAQKEEKRKRRGLFLWLFCGVLLLSSTAGYFVWNHSTKISNPQSSNLEIASQTEKSLMVYDKADMNTSHKLNTSEATITQKKQTNIDASQTILTEKTTNRHNNNNGTNHTPYPLTSQSSFNQQTSNNRNEEVVHSNQDNEVNSMIPTLDANQSKKNQLVPNLSLKSKLDLSTTLVDDIPLKPLFNEQQEMDKSNWEIGLMAVDCPRFNRTKGFFFVEGLYGANLNLKSLSSKIGNEGNAYLLKRLDSERALYSSSGGIRIGYELPMGLSVATGAEYGQITERFSYEDLDAIKTKTVITFDTTFLADGTFTTTADTFRIITHGSEITRIVNRYKSLDIPISLAYNIRGHRMDVVLKASALFNVFFQPSGKVLGLDGKPTAIHNLPIDEGIAMKNRMNTRFDFAVGLNFHMNKYLDFIVEPYFKTSTGDIAGANSPLRQSYTTFGLRTGVKYIINK